MINSVLPARIGEIIRPAIIKKREKIPFSHAVTTLVTERILDAITLIALFVWMVGTVHIDPDMEVEVLGYNLSMAVLERAASALIVVSVVLGSLVIAMNIPAFQRLLKRGVKKIPGLFVFSGEAFQEKIRSRVCTALFSIIDNVVAGMSIVKFPKELLICVFYSSMIWLLQAVAFYITSFGAPLIDLTFSQVTTVFVIICFFIMLPSVPGFWGIWEAAGVFGLALFEVGAREALGFSLTIHVVLMVPVVLAGVISLGITGMEILRTSGAATEKNNGAT
jgi:glycosyltransferase 2 family protein